MSFWKLCLRIAVLVLMYYLGYETRPVVDRWRPAIQLWINRPRIFPLRKPEPKPTPTATPSDTKPRPHIFPRPFRDGESGDDGSGFVSQTGK